MGGHKKIFISYFFLVCLAGWEIIMDMKRTRDMEGTRLKEQFGLLSMGRISVSETHGAPPSAASLSPARLIYQEREKRAK